jgi:hypothetical protein
VLASIIFKSHAHQAFVEHVSACSPSANILFRGWIQEPKLSFSMFWTLGIALLLVSGPVALSLDDMILSVLKRRFPQLDGKPIQSVRSVRSACESWPPTGS